MNNEGIQNSRIAVDEQSSFIERVIVQGKSFGMYLWVFIGLAGIYSLIDIEVVKPMLTGKEYGIGWVFYETVLITLACYYLGGLGTHIFYFLVRRKRKLPYRVSCRASLICGFIYVMALIWTSCVYCLNNGVASDFKNMIYGGLPTVISYTVIILSIILSIRIARQLTERSYIILIIANLLLYFAFNAASSLLFGKLLTATAA